jgi:DNA-binding NtrC family response regulator
MMAFNSGPLLHFADLPSTVAGYARASCESGLVAAAVVGGRLAASQQSVVPLQELERRAIHHALQFTGGDRTSAAQMLGIGRTTLYRKLREYRLE